MKTIGELIKLSTLFLEERSIENPRRTAEDLLAFVLKAKRMDLYLQFDKPVIEEELSVMRDLLKKRGKGEPFEYVVGEVPFFGSVFKVDSRVLIPRPETEIMVEMISKKITLNKMGKGQELWDVCTGSGCIGISLKKAFPDLHVVLSDLSEPALGLAAENAKLNGVQVEILHGDLLAPFKGRKADYIVSNPPYISKDEFFELDPSVRLFEPEMALVGGDRGTEIYERLERDLPTESLCFFEIGSLQKESIQQIFHGRGEVHNDWAGHPRFFFLENLNNL